MAQLHEAIPSHSARAATKRALVHSLQALRGKEAKTKAKCAQIKADNSALQKAVVAKLHTNAEIKAITAQFRLVHASFTCTG